ncbi:MAG: acetate kinase [Clostridia bacterium]|nr:acetate kinase [Clostridia bacterium]
MNILVINCGSSSLKYQLIDMDNQDVISKGNVERIGIEGSILKHKTAENGEVEIEKDMKDHTEAMNQVIKMLVDKKHGAIKSMDEIAAVGHRVLHGGNKFIESVVVDAQVKKAIRDNFDLGPLHNPANLMGIEACEKVMPDTPMVAVFDTAFHQTMPEEAYMYALPYEVYEKYSIRRYGFHGTSHKYVSRRTAKFLNLPYDSIKTIVCHLGNGSSISAVKDGKCVDTSMGLTPLEGLPMGTRCGSIDPAIVPFLMTKENMSPQDIDVYMNKKSGVLGISGISSDFRDLEAAASEGNKRAELALKMFIYSVKKYIGAYAAAMGGLDVIAFTAGIGENTALIRKEICDGLDFLNIHIDHQKNKVRGKEAIISSDDSKVKVVVIPTNEELMIAQETQEIVFDK